MIDNNYDVVIEKDHSALNDFFIDYLCQKIGDSDFLDVGCNSGFLIEKCGHGHGIDASVAMVLKAQSKLLDVQWGDASKLEYSDNEFPTVVLSCILEQNDNPMEILKEALRVASEKVIGITPIPNASVWGRIGGTKWVKSVVDPAYLRKIYNTTKIDLFDTHYYFEIKKGES